MVMVLTFTLILVIAILGVSLSRSSERHDGAPAGYRVLASDLLGRGVVLRDTEWGLTGKVDLLLENVAGELVVAEYKRAWPGYTAGTCRRSHAVQLAAYFVLCQGDSRLARAPVAGVLRYIDERGRVVPGGEVRIANTPEVRQQVMAVVERLRRAKLSGAEVHRTHNSPYNCRRCYDRARCGEARVA
jgi:hypothetical protein